MTDDRDLSVCPDGDLCPGYDGSGLNGSQPPLEYEGDNEWWGSDN